MNVFDYFFESSAGLEKEFILGSKEKVSYAELYKNSQKLASYLRHEIGENQKIIVLIPNSVYFVTVYLAIFKSGNICVPLNPGIEPSNLDFVVNKCKSKYVFTSKRAKALLNLPGCNLIDEDDLEKILSNEYDLLDIDIAFEENRVAEIIFTSGSTGEPKGVMLSHKNIMANTSSIIEYLQLSEKDIVEVVMPFYYCYGLSLMHTHLRVGGSIVINNSFIFIGAVLNDLINFKCTGFAGVPSHYQILLRKTKSFKETKFPHLRYVTQAGGKLHNAFITEFTEAFPEIRFYVMYGQTEATARLSYLPPNMLPEKIGSMGKGIPGVELRVVDEHNKPVSPGHTGEVIAHGDNVMLGYLEDEAGTNQVIRDGWLFTGDLATVDEDGYIFLTARKKEILKVGGKRVSPKEIEEVIVSIPEVVDCTIEGVEDDLLGEAIKAIIVVQNAEDTQIDEAYIKKYCADRLVMYKVPQIIEFISQLTVSATGKKVKVSF